MLLKFDYVNWRGDKHTYVIEPEGTITCDADHPTETYRNTWLLHGQVVTRDGDVRLDMGPTRRRSFILVGMKNIEEVERSK